MRGRRSNAPVRDTANYVKHAAHACRCPRNGSKANMASITLRMMLFLSVSLRTELQTTCCYVVWYRTGGTAHL